MKNVCCDQNTLITGVKFPRAALLKWVYAAHGYTRQRKNIRGAASASIWKIHQEFPRIEEYSSLEYKGTPAAPPPPLPDPPPPSRLPS